MPADELLEILLPSVKPCDAFKSTCSNVFYKPDNGYVPRGWIGGSGSMNDVQVIFVTAEPARPDGSVEKYPKDDPTETLRLCNTNARVMLRDKSLRRDGHPADFHDNLCTILDEFFPDVALDEQLKKCWITPSVLCSLNEVKDKNGKRKTTPHPSDVVKACADLFLEKQLKALPNAVVVALGNDAKKRLSRMNLKQDVIYTWHPSIRYSFIDEARANWSRAADDFRKIIASRTAALPHGNP